MPKIQRKSAILPVISQLLGRQGPKTRLRPPGIVLVDPKYAHNVGAVVRAASCFGIENVVYTGDRVRMELERTGRLPREERLRGYKEVSLINYNYPTELFESGVPVAVELKEGSENLADFDHPDNAVYVFGPEDGSIGKNVATICHRFVHIPSRHCLNLSAAVYVVLYDRLLHRNRTKSEPFPTLADVEEFQPDGLFDFKTEA